MHYFFLVFFTFFIPIEVQGKEELIDVTYLEQVALAGTLSITDPIKNKCVQAPRAGKTVLKCEGLSFILHVPKICLTRSCGLIVNVHGWRMSAKQQDRYTRLSTLAGNKGYIVLNPQAKKTVYGRSWSAKDDAKVLAVINSVEEAFEVMKQRIHITGFSQGGHMTWRFVCKYADKFGSVAPIGSGAGKKITADKRASKIEIMDNCFGASELDILYAHGRTDGLVPYYSAIETLKTIGKNWQLGNAKVISEDSKFKRIRFNNLKGTKLEFISYDFETEYGTLLGHCFPGEAGSLGCGKDNSFHWGEELLEFFIANPKQAEL